MGTCYDLVSDSKMESFDLGKSFWGIFWSDFQESRISCDKCNGFGVIPPGPGIDKLPCVSCNTTGRIKKEGFRPTSYEELSAYFCSKITDYLLELSDDDLKYFDSIIKNIWIFMETHPDWKVINSDTSDYSTFNTKEELEEDKIKWPSKEDDEWTRYIEVGTRYTK